MTILQKLREVANEDRRVSLTHTMVRCETLLALVNCANVCKAIADDDDEEFVTPISIIREVARAAIAELEREKP